MLNQICPSLRTDLIVSIKEDSENNTNIYSIQIPDSAATFQFGEEEFFLCQCLNGKFTIEQIINNFKQKFGVAIGEQDFNSFLTEINQFGLLSNYSFTDKNQVNKGSFINDNEDEDDLFNDSNNNAIPHWSIISNAEPFFANIVTILRPLLVIYPLSLWALIPVFIIALTLWFQQRLLIAESLNFGHKIGSFLVMFGLSLLLINLVTKVGRGIIANHYGAKVNDFGMLIRWGFVPRFYLKIKNINNLNKQRQLLVYSSPLYFRSFLFILGTFLWYFNLGNGNSLSAWGLLFAIMGLASFIQTAMPLRPASSGARIIAILMNKSANYPRQLFKRSLSNLFHKNQSKPLTFKEFLIVLSGLIVTILLCLIVINISMRFALGLTRSFPNIFGRGTYHIILFILLFLGFNYLKNVFASAKKSNRRNNRKQQNLDNNEEVDEEILKLSRELGDDDFLVESPPPPPRKKYGKYLWILLFLIISLIPIPYSVGGDCQLLPPKQQEIQAPISGKFIEIFYQGGDGILIKKGSVIANMVSADLQNQILTLQEKIRDQQAQKQQSLAALNQLQKGSRQEEIEISQQQVEVARQEVNVSLSQVEVAQKEVEEAQAELESEREVLKSLQQQLNSAIVSFEFSEKEVARLQPLYKEGGLALQRLETSQKQLETDRISVAEKNQNLNTQGKIIEQIEAKLSGRRKNLEQVRQISLTKEKSLQEAQAKLNLVLSGNTVDDIEVAQQEVQSKNAELNRLQQELKYSQAQNSSGKLLMPFDGYLVESYLDKKEGSYLNQGETFATAQDDSKLIAQLQIPEYDAGGIKISAPAQVKLLAYPNQPLDGKVVAIEPTTKEEKDQSLVRVSSVQIELDSKQVPLKPGMSGYGKIPQGKKPLIVVMTRPLIRFLQIEFWSWLP